jgi:hypothetical protein
MSPTCIMDIGIESEIGPTLKSQNALMLVHTA